MNQKQASVDALEHGIGYLFPKCDLSLFEMPDR